MNSLDNPQLDPSGHAYSIIQFHGVENGGWGPAAVTLPPLIKEPTPIIYTGDDEHTLFGLRDVAEKLAQDTGKPTRLVRYSVREDIASFGEE